MFSNHISSLLVEISLFGLFGVGPLWIDENVSSDHILSTINSLINWLTAELRVVAHSH